MTVQKSNRKWNGALIATLLLLFSFFVYIMVLIIFPTHLENANEFIAGNEKRSDLWGMMLIDIQNNDSARSYHVKDLGVYVLTVEEEAAAYRAGIRAGDRIVACNGKLIEQSMDLDVYVANSTQSEEVVWRIYRPVTQSEFEFVVPSSTMD